MKKRFTEEQTIHAVKKLESGTTAKELSRELGVSQVQGYICGKPMKAEEARELANSSRVEAEGYQCVREPRHRLMRRAIAAINGVTTEIRLRNISAMGALVECDVPVAPGARLAMEAHVL